MATEDHSGKQFKKFLVRKHLRYKGFTYRTLHRVNRCIILTLLPLTPLGPSAPGMPGSPSSPWKLMKSRTYAPSLETFKVRLDRALSNLIYFKMFLLIAEGLD